MPFPPTPSITPSNTPTPSITASQTPTLSPTETVCPGSSPTITPSVSLTPSITPSITPTNTQTKTPTGTIVLTPTNTSSPTNTPTQTPPSETCTAWEIYNGSFFEISWSGILCGTETSTGGTVAIGQTIFTTCIKDGTLGYTGSPTITVDAIC